MGANVRFGSIVTNLALEPTRRRGDTFRASCQADGGEACGLCKARCPVGAITESGLDKSKCYAMRQAVRERCMEPYIRELHMLPTPIVVSGRRENGYSLGCALCQTRVPCEGADPHAEEEAGEALRPGP